MNDINREYWKPLCELLEKDDGVLRDDSEVHRVLHNQISKQFTSFMNELDDFEENLGDIKNEFEHRMTNMQDDLDETACKDDLPDEDDLGEVLELKDKVTEIDAGLNDVKDNIEDIEEEQTKHDHSLDEHEDKIEQLMNWKEDELDDWADEMDRDLNQLKNSIESNEDDSERLSTIEERLDHIEDRVKHILHEINDLWHLDRPGGGNV